jgi:hypothetical protein
LRGREEEQGDRESVKETHKDSFRLGEIFFFWKESVKKWIFFGGGVTFIRVVYWGLLCQVMRARWGQASGSYSLSVIRELRTWVAGRQTSGDRQTEIA